MNFYCNFFIFFPQFCFLPFVKFILTNLLPRRRCRRNERLFIYFLLLLCRSTKKNIKLTKIRSWQLNNNLRSSEGFFALSTSNFLPFHISSFLFRSCRHYIFWVVEAKETLKKNSLRWSNLPKKNKKEEK